VLSLLTPSLQQLWLTSSVTPASSSISSVIESEVNSFINQAYSYFGWEVCDHPYVHEAGVRRLRTALKKHLHGQHLAVDITTTAVKAHLEDPDPQKALVLSFHGWAGSGKTFTTKHFMNSLYERGVNSSFVQFFLASYHFPDATKISEYQTFIKRSIKRVVNQCPRALFIFDEVDKIPTGVLDALVPYIEHPGQVLDGNDYKKAIYVFLSNVGATEITRIAELAWKDGRRREELTFKDFQQTLSNEAFSTRATGLYRSRMIDKVLVDHFIPFLPLERHHVTECIKAEATQARMTSPNITNEVEKIADMLSYWPDDLKLYSTTGCKKVHSFVKYRIAELELENFKDEDDEAENESSYEVLRVGEISS